MPLQLASLFQDHAVLQRDRPLPVWGRGPAGARVRITLAGHVAVAACNGQGDFLAHLPALPAGGPHSLLVEDPATGERLEIRDLLVGEVWLASGQSNMEMNLNACRPLSAGAIASADHPGIRFFNVATRAFLGPQSSVDGRWSILSTDTAGRCSAAAFACARRLHVELGVPVGLILAAWGGTFIQSWLSRPALAANPDTAGWLDRFESEAWTERRWALMDAPGPDGRVTNLPRDPGNLGAGRGWAGHDFDDSDWPSVRLPATWQSLGRRHSGVFWFRRTLTLPAAWTGRELRLDLGAADKQDVAYVNGVEVGRTGSDLEEQHWDVPRSYPVPAALVTGPVITIAVRVYSFVFDGGLIGPAAAMRLHPADDPATPLPLAGEWRMTCEHDLGLVTERHLAGHGERNTPHILFDNMIRPLAPYALRGVLWYQGESNAENPGGYARLLRDLVLDWRHAWGLPEMAFHVVQLPGFKAPRAHQPDSDWALIREAQAAILGLPGTGLTVNIDLGEEADIHPKNKLPVGERLAQNVLALVHGRAGSPCGPLFDRVTPEGSALRCHFRHAEAGLRTTDGEAPRTFFIAGADRVFRPATASIEGACVLVAHADVPRPVAVRHAWADNPAGCNLAARDGSPAAPFRSDRW